MNTSPNPLERAQSALRRGGTVHCMGIGGVGVAGLARLLAARGMRVTGCDTARNRLTDSLEASGIAVALGHGPAHVAPPPDWLVRTAAVPATHPEVRAALAAAVPVSARGEALAAVVATARGVAVCGTHGKTTTTTMAAQAFRAAGLDPSFCIGGEVDILGGVAGTGTSDWLVVEADESDGTLALYAPEIAIVTNVDFDHMEHFEDVAAFHAVFESVVARTRGTVCYGRDDEVATRIAGRRAGAVGFGLDPASDVRGEARRVDGTAQEFDVVAFGGRLGRARLPVPGRHNVLNALGAIAAALAAGASPGPVLDSLAGFRPARRRLEPFLDRGGIRVFSDYAHHPAEIRALLDAVREGFAFDRLVAVFQPHRYTRTRALGPQFPPAFRGVDRLVLAPVYAASEAPLPGGTSDDLLAEFRRQGGVPVEPAGSLEAAWAALRSDLRPGDLLLVIGAGDVERIAAWAAAGL
ncbi:MAG: UDP-N-acetylmuramate--L-alanine ligase [Lentisphaerae bacterium]|nr:UDP-N-acetylmuramate--L-alanine ligase [Lentisphaerota bacterium]